MTGSVVWSDDSISNSYSCAQVGNSYFSYTTSNGAVLRRIATGTTIPLPQGRSIRQAWQATTNRIILRFYSWDNETGSEYYLLSNDTLTQTAIGENSEPNGFYWNTPDVEMCLPDGSQVFLYKYFIYIGPDTTTHTIISQDLVDSLNLSLKGASMGTIYAVTTDEQITLDINGNQIGTWQDWYPIDERRIGSTVYTTWSGPDNQVVMTVNGRHP